MIACVLVAITLPSCRTPQGGQAGSAQSDGSDIKSTIKPLLRPAIFGPKKENGNHASFKFVELGQIQFYTHGAIVLKRNDETSQRRIINGRVVYLDAKFVEDHSFYHGIPVLIAEIEDNGNTLIVRVDTLNPDRKIRFRLQADGKWHFAPVLNVLTYDGETYQYTDDSKDSYLLYDEGGVSSTESISTQASGALIHGARRMVDPPGGPNSNFEIKPKDTTPDNSGNTKKSGQTGDSGDGTIKNMSFDTQGNVTDSLSTQPDSTTPLKTKTSNGNGGGTTNPQQNNQSTQPAKTKTGGGLKPRR